jgi:[acyl-carrier-protein] S-malonyltransferase
MSSTEGTVILCPGQGAQHVGMAKEWIEKSPAAAATFAEADEALGRKVSEVCFEGPADQLNRTDVAQAAIYVASVASYRGLIETGVLTEDESVAIAGLSLGEYTALHLAGVISFADGLRLVDQRGQFMQAAAEASDSSMVALRCGDEAEVLALCEAASGGETLVPANFNSPQQIVISGTTDACRRAVEEAARREIGATEIAVAGAFHSPIMAPAAERMAEALAAVTWSEPRLTVLANVTGEPHGTDTQEIQKLLVAQITQSVRWHQDVRWLVDHISGRYVELSPGKVLMGLMRRIERSVRVENQAVPK